MGTAEGRYITTFSFSLEQYEAKSLEMISAYWSSTLLMVCSQTGHQGRHPESSNQREGEREENNESHSSETTSYLDTYRDPQTLWLHGS